MCDDNVQINNQCYSTIFTMGFFMCFVIFCALCFFGKKILKYHLLLKELKNLIIQECSFFFNG